MMSQLLTHASLLGQLPADVEEQVKDILDRILRLAGYNANSNTGSNPVGGTMTANFLPISYQQTIFVFKFSCQDHNEINQRPNSHHCEESETHQNNQGCIAH
jgi:hypothetical protein